MFRLELGDLLLQSHDLSQFWPHLAIARKGRCRCRRYVSHPAAKNALGNIQIAGCLRDREARSVTSFTASILNSRLNFRLVICNLQFLGQDLIFVSTKPAAAQG